MWLDSEKWNGFVRPIVTLAAMGAVIWGFLVGTIGQDVFVPFATGLITWYYKTRDEQKKG